MLVKRLYEHIIRGTGIALVVGISGTRLERKFKSLNSLFYWSDVLKIASDILEKCEVALVFEVTFKYLWSVWLAVNKWLRQTAILIFNIGDVYFFS